MQDTILPEAAVSIPKAEFSEKKEESGASKDAKRAERLKILRERQEKALTAQAAAEKRTNDINLLIAKIEQDIHNDEIKALDEFCSKNNMNYKSIIEFFEFPRNMEIFRKFMNRKDVDNNEQGID